MLSRCCSGWVGGNPHFTGEEMEAQGGQGVDLATQSVEMGQESGPEIILFCCTHGLRAHRAPRLPPRLQPHPALCPDALTCPLLPAGPFPGTQPSGCAPSFLVCLVLDPSQPFRFRSPAQDANPKDGPGGLARHPQESTALGLPARLPQHLAPCGWGPVGHPCPSASTQ